MFRSHKDTIRTPVKIGKEAKRKYYCDLCEDEEDKSYAWDFELDFEIHRRRVHKVELLKMMKEPKNHMCSVCMRTHTDRPTLLAHIKKYHLLSADCSFVKRDIFICDYCNNLFFNKLLLIAHIKYYHLNLTQKRHRTICPACNKSIRVRSIWFHFLYHGIHTSTCPICVVTFENCEDVMEHLENHAGYYMCNLCIFASQNENLFQNHMEKHKKTISLDGKDVNDVLRFFVPQKRPASWNRKFLNLFRGITMSPELQICVMCRAICDTEEQMIQHIHGDHSAIHKVEIKRHMCICGEEFFNNVLLRHHIFMKKDGHRDLSGPSTPNRPSIESITNSASKKPIKTEVEISFNGNNSAPTLKPEVAILIEKDEVESDGEQTSSIKYSWVLSSNPEENTNQVSQEHETVYETVYKICSDDDVAEVLVNYGQGSQNVEQVSIESRSMVDEEPQTMVYEMIEIPVESSEETDRVVMEEPMYMT